MSWHRIHRTAHLGAPHLGAGPEVGYGSPNDGQDYIDRAALTFDPADGLLSGTAVRSWHHVPPTRPSEAPAPATAAQRAAERDAESEKAGAGPYDVRRHQTAERADIEAGAEIDHTVSL